MIPGLDMPSAYDDHLHSWLTNHQERFPVVCAIAASDLYVPATSADVKRMFGNGRRVLFRPRPLLTADRAEILAFLCENIFILENL
jgi:hypothetical protein